MVASENRKTKQDFIYIVNNQVDSILFPILTFLNLEFFTIPYMKHEYTIETYANNCVAQFFCTFIS